MPSPYTFSPYILTSADISYGNTNSYLGDAAVCESYGYFWNHGNYSAFPGCGDNECCSYVGAPAVTWSCHNWDSQDDADMKVLGQSQSADVWMWLKWPSASGG